jgi:hypothetical protein
VKRVPGKQPTCVRCKEKQLARDIDSGRYHRMLNAEEKRAEWRHQERNFLVEGTNVNTGRHPANLQ